MATKQLRHKVVPFPLSNQIDVHLPEASGAERVEYMVDMLLQLKGMAAASRLHVLSGILEVAYQEARARARRS